MLRLYHPCDHVGAARSGPRLKLPKPLQLLEGKLKVALRHLEVGEVRIRVSVAGDVQRLNLILQDEGHDALNLLALGFADRDCVSSSCRQWKLDSKAGLSCLSALAGGQLASWRREVLAEDDGAIALKHVSGGASRVAMVIHALHPEDLKQRHRTKVGPPLCRTPATSG